MKAAKQDKFESQSASVANDSQTKDNDDAPEESKSVSFADDSNTGKQKKKRKKAKSKMSKAGESEQLDGESEVDRLVEESKEAIQRLRQDPNDEEEKSASSLSSYDKIEGKGRYKCRACVQSFMSKKLLEKHRKTLEHKVREKKYSVDH